MPPRASRSRSTKCMGLTSLLAGLPAGASGGRRHGPFAPARARQSRGRRALFCGFFANRRGLKTLVSAVRFVQRRSRVYDVWRPSEDEHEARYTLRRSSGCDRAQLFRPIASRAHGPPHCRMLRTLRPREAADRCLALPIYGTLLRIRRRPLSASAGTPKESGGACSPAVTKVRRLCDETRSAPSSRGPSEYSCGGMFDRHVDRVDRAQRSSCPSPMPPKRPPGHGGAALFPPAARTPRGRIRLPWSGSSPGQAPRQRRPPRPSCRPVADSRASTNLVRTRSVLPFDLSQ